MILQLGVGFANLFQGIASKVLPTLGSIGLNIGNQYATGLINRELTRDARNDVQDQIKAQLRAAANAISPTVAPGQTAVYSGGPPVGSAFRPPTLIPPSIQPPQRVLQIDPGLVNPVVSNSFAFSRRPPGAFRGELPIQSAFLPGLIAGGARALGGVASRLGGVARAGVPRAMAGTTAAAIAIETAAGVGTDFIFPSTAFAPGRDVISGFPQNGNPLRLNVGGSSMPMAPPVTGLPGIGRFQREANGCRVQWYLWGGDMGVDPQPIDRGEADCLKRDCIYRLDVFRGKFIKLKSRRINPMNVRAFFRAGRRVDAGERICRKMFSEHRKTKTGTVRRKRTRKAKR